MYVKLFVVLSFACMCSAEYKHTEKRTLSRGLLNTGGSGYALLVGLNDCDALPSDSIPKLKSAESDVERMYALLDKQQYTVTAITGKDATIGAVEKAIKQLSDSAKSTDRLLFYFSGHGVILRNSRPLRSYVEDVNEKDTFCILLRKPAGQSFYNEYFAMSEVVTTMNSSKALQRVVLLDACFSGASNPETIPNRDLYNHVLSNASYFSLTTWADIAYEGYYTDAILEGLKGKADKHMMGNSDKKVDAFELSRYVDFTVGRKLRRKNGEVFRARTAFIGAGALFITNVDGK